MTLDFSWATLERTQTANGREIETGELMGILDSIERKTMRNYQSFLASMGIDVELGTTSCSNFLTYRCRRDHQCITFQESRERRAKLFFYRCGGHIWLNGSHGKSGAVAPWSNNVSKEAGLVGNLIKKHESSGG